MEHGADCDVGEIDRSASPVWRPNVHRALIRLMAWIGIFFTVASLVFLAFSPMVIDRTARRIFANTVPPNDVELPQTAFSPPLSSWEVGALIGRGEGLNCSIEPLVRLLAFRDGGRSKASVNLQYRQACVSHDLCYRHGAATYGYTQSDCDAFLVRDAFRLCKQLSDRKATIDRCMGEARRVYAGVVFGGADAFRRADPALRYKDDIETALDRVSTVAEYQAYLDGRAALAVPRIVRNADGSADLLYIKHRPGGEAYRRLTWRKGEFVETEQGFLPSRYDTIPSLPLLFEGGVGSVLAWWRRDKTDHESTGGTFELATAGVLSRLTKETPRPEKPDSLDPSSASLTPVQGPAGDHLAHFVGITNKSGNGRCGGEENGTATLKIVHVSVDTTAAAHPGRSPAVRCMTYTVASPVFDGQPSGTGFATDDIDYYRYLAIPPVAHFVRGRIEVVLFRRGDAKGRDYDQTLLSSTVVISGGIADRKRVALRSTDSCWNFPETAEPIVPIVDTNGRLARLAGLNLTDSDARIWTATPAVLTRSGCRKTPVPKLFDVSALRGWTHLRIPVLGEGAGRPANFPSDINLVAVRLAPVCLRQRSKHNKECTFDIEVKVATTRTIAGRLSIDRSTLGQMGLAIDGSQAIQRIAHTVPVIADMNGDGVPDLLLADTQTGSRSTIYHGTRARNAALGFNRARGN